ncbi:RNA-directed DNA polymerase, eukaryota, reverse transcriptase zinc-binding domain protein [Tanacetum coccineum]|uniref:RNA-directed DNA polymerase, eukaryota, reverse transcriptase zinc-binding domain protein n=1 Tax=Tanacetum coccineum TaxID=301880 RepID=A0ABQ5INU5_9ASTR
MLAKRVKKLVGKVQKAFIKERFILEDLRNKERVTDKGRWVNNEWQREWDWVMSHSGRDRWRWMLQDNGELTVKVLTRLVEEKVLRVENGNQETLWNNGLPKKINIFVWRDLKGRLAVREELDERGIDLNTLLFCIVIVWRKLVPIAW